jgi:hypothetical protein
MRRNNSLNLIYDHPHRSLKVVASGALTIIVLVTATVLCFYLWLHR